MKTIIKKEKPQRKGGGRAFNLYLQTEDLQRFDKLATYIATHGHPMGVSASRIVKALLRCAEPNAELVRAFEEALAADARRK